MLQIWLEFIGKMAWPTVALIALYIFRHDVRSFLVRVQRAKFGAVEFQTEEKVRQVLAQAVEISSDSPTFTGPDRVASGQRQLTGPIRAPLEDATQDRYAAIVQVRNELYQMVRSLAISRNLVKSDNATRAPLPWLIQRLRITIPSLSREFDTLGQILTTADEILRDPKVSETTVRELVEAANLVSTAIGEKAR